MKFRNHEIACVKININGLMRGFTFEEHQTKLQNRQSRKQFCR